MITLIDKEGEELNVAHAIDAKELIASGEYSLLESKPEKKKAEKKPEKEAEKDSGFFGRGAE